MRKRLSVLLVTMMATSILSYVFLFMDYMCISTKLLFLGNYTTNFSGYNFLTMFAGKARITSCMVLLLMFASAAIVITAILAMFDRINYNALKKLLAVEICANSVAAVIPIFHVSVLMKMFEDSSTHLGVGLFLNIAMAAVNVVAFFMLLKKPQLSLPATTVEQIANDHPIKLEMNGDMKQ